MFLNIVRLSATKPSQVNLGFQVRYPAGEKDLNKETFVFIVILITEELGNILVAFQ